MSKYILAIDQSTSATKIILVDGTGKIVDSASYAHRLIRPNSDWVEYDAEEIYENTLKGLKKFVDCGREISGIGITNQTGAFVLWDRHTGVPVYNAIGWQCSRGKPVCDSLSKEEQEVFIAGTGDAASPFLPASKLRLILDENKDIYEMAKNGDICFGSMDSWLIFKLTSGKKHVTDYGNACMMQLLNLYKRTWDDNILKILDIPKSILPQLTYTDGDFGEVSEDGLPKWRILCVAGDSNAAMFSQFAFNKGDVKITYGTGASLLCNMGEELSKIAKGFTPVIAWNYNGVPTYALEGTVVCAGDTVVWLKEIGLISDSKETEALATSVRDAGGVFFVPAFTGLGTPDWDTTARATIVGVSRDTSRAHIVRAAIEGIAHQIADIYDELGLEAVSIFVDGGTTKNSFLMQFQADMLGRPIKRQICDESSARGVAYMSGIKAGIWPDREAMKGIINAEYTVYNPQMGKTQKDRYRNGWTEAVKKSKSSIF